MSAITSPWITPPAIASSAGSAAIGALNRVWRAVRTAHRIRQTRRELLRLDDRLLADVGMSRQDLDPVIAALARSLTPGAWR